MSDLGHIWVKDADKKYYIIREYLYDVVNQCLSKCYLSLFGSHLGSKLLIRFL